jgi:hypothetical protein
MTEQTAIQEAEQYVERLIESQGALGYKAPQQAVVTSAVDEAAEAVRALAALSESKG